MAIITFLSLVLSLFLDVILANPRCFPLQTAQPPDHRDCFNIVADDIISNPISSRTFSFAASNLQSTATHFRLPHLIRNPKFPHCEIWIGAHRRGQSDTFKFLEIARTAMRIMNTCMLEYDEHEYRSNAGQDDVFSGGLVYVLLTRPNGHLNEEPSLSVNDTGTGPAILLNTTAGLDTE